MEKFITRFVLILVGALSAFATWAICNIAFKEFTIGGMVKGLFDGEKGQGIAFIILFVIIFSLIALAIYKIGMKMNLFKKKESLATGQFAKHDEFEGFTGNDGLIIGKKFRLSAKKSFEHVVIVGPTGSGKSASFFIPNLLNLPDSSIIVSDPKGELFEKTAATNLAQGKRVLVFSPFKENSMKYNPLALCKNVSEVREMTQILLANGNASIEALTGTKAGGAEWTNMATPLLCAFLLYVKDLSPPKNTITYALNLIVENDLDTMKFLMMDADDAARRQFNIFLQSAESEKTASSIKTVLATNLQIFMDPMIEEVTNDNEIDPMMLREQPTVIYMVVPEAKSASMSPIMGPLYNQLMAKLAENGNGYPVFFLLDEFPSLGKLGSISNVLATVRSRKMSLALGIQSINQLKQNYGQEESGSILDNLKTKCILPGSSFDTAQYFSQMAGFKEISTTSTSFAKDNLSHSVSAQKRELLTADEIRRLPDGSALIISDNRNVLMENQLRYYENERMLKLTEYIMDIDEFVTNWRRENNSKNNHRNTIEKSYHEEDEDDFQFKL